MTDKEQRWTEIEHLPEWDEEFYHIYTAKKFGKWVMIKTLKPEYADDPRFQHMIEQEFDVRYSLAHPNIIMINDFEDIPGIGRCIVTDDVYGDSLRKLIDKRQVMPAHIEQLRHQLVNALDYIETKHIVHPALKPENIIFTENIGNLKLIDVGFDQRNSLSHADTNDDIEAYGRLMQEVLRRTGRRDPRMARIADRAAAGGYRDVQELELAIGGRRSRGFAIVAAFVILALAAVLAWLLYNPNALPQS